MYKSDYKYYVYLKDYTIRHLGDTFVRMGGTWMREIKEDILVCPGVDSKSFLDNIKSRTGNYYKSKIVGVDKADYELTFDEFYIKVVNYEEATELENKRLDEAFKKEENKQKEKDKKDKEKLYEKLKKELGK